MAENSKNNVIINNILSFIKCKLMFVSKAKLLNCINNYYSKLDISKALKALLASLPVEVSKKFRKQVKSSDPLTLIYDCIQTIKIEDLPIFVCKDLNDVPCLDSELYKEKTNSEDEEKEMNDDKCRKEQAEMKIQILKIMSIITELKNGLEKINKAQNTKLKVEKKEKIKNTMDFSSLKDNKGGNSSQDGLALIQSLIDEDYENSEMNIMAEEDHISNSSDSEFSLSGVGDCDADLCIEESNKSNFLKTKKLSAANFVTKLSTETTTVFSNTDTLDEKIISIDGDETFILKNGKASSVNRCEDTIDMYKTCLPHTEAISVSRKNSSHIVNQNESENEFDPSQEDKHDFRACAPEKCPVCNDTFVSKLDYDQHAKTHYTKGSYNCSLCSTSFTSRDNLVEHFVSCFLERKHRYNLDKYTCPVCQSFYADQASLIKHKSFHSECRLFPCSYCPYRYFSSSALKMHIRNQHNPMNKYQCPLCDLSFLCNSYLLAHIAIHNGSKPFRCKICNHKADTKKAIKQHIHSHGKHHPKKLKCKECSYTCNGKYILLKHRLIKHREPVRCSFCDKTFKNPSAYKRHYDLHRNKNNVKCRLCLYSTPFKRYLDKHMLTHTSNVNYECPKCHVPLSSKHTIGHHLRSYCKISVQERNQ